MESQAQALFSPNPDLKIRPVRLSDARILHKTCWADRTAAYVHQVVSRAQYFAIQGRGLGVVVVAPDSTNLVAFGQLTLWAKCGEISDLIVNEHYRGHGLGTAMIQYLTRASREMHVPYVEIGAAESNPRALDLYRRLGFVAYKTLNLDVGTGYEPVIYLRLKFPDAKKR